MNLVEVLEIHAVSGPESGVVASPSASVESFILSTHLNLGVVAAEVVVETCIDSCGRIATSPFYVPNVSSAVAE